MTTKVEFYSLLRDLTGTAELELPLADGTTLEALLGELYARHPKLAERDRHMLLAADLDYVDRTHAIQPDEVISTMPPVQVG